MNRCICLCFLILTCSVSVLKGEIFADFVISQGGAPAGTFRVQLHADQAPRTVANFIGLATGKRPWLHPQTNRLMVDTPYYDGLTFHRLVHNFVIQGGDPLGTGAGGPGYVFQDEFDPALRHDGPYLLSMANSGFNTNGSQFFITLAATPHLDDRHTIFGEVTSGRTLIDGFMDPGQYPTDTENRPVQPLIITSVTMGGSSLADFLETLDEHALPTWRSVPTTLSWSTPEGASQPALELAFSRQDRWDYAAIRGDDLVTWPHLNFAVSLGTDPGQKLDFTDATGILNGAARGFIQMHGLDYSAQPDPPRDLFAPGTILDFTFSHGLLSITFGENATASTWTYTPQTGDPRSGVLTSRTGLSIPAEGFFLGSPGQSLARFLLLRTTRLFFDQQIVQGEWGEMEPTLSFHTDNSGWFREISFDNQSPLPGIEGTFTITVP